jgi:acetolactate decarboxylase
MKKIVLAGLLYFSIFVIMMPFEAAAAEKNEFYQVSTISALQEGVYDGAASLRELKAYGNFGIGTYDGLDGEMLLLDRVFYRVRADGKVTWPDDRTKTPFAEVVFFVPDKTVELTDVKDYKQLQSAIEALLPSKNIPYAIRMDGDFSYIKTRSVPAQAKPYPRLADAVKGQALFEIKEAKGTIIGFWLPQYFAGINMPGFHLHFINDSRTAGGHLLECAGRACTLKIAYIYGASMKLPKQSDFFGADLKGDKQKELKTIE